MGSVDPEKRQAATARLRELAAAGTLTSRHVRLTAAGCGVSERTVWRWIDPCGPAADGRARPGYRLTNTDRAAYAFYRGNAAAVHRARRAVVEGAVPPGGTAVPADLAAGWAGERPVSLRTLQAAFAAQLTPAERALRGEGENARRAAQVHLTRPASVRNQVWEGDPTPLGRIDPERLRHLLLAGDERTVGKDGIRFNNLSYLAPELQGRGGQRVQIRYMPHDDRTIEVYAGAEHLCTAHPQAHLTPEQVQEFRAAQKQEARRLAAERRRSTRRARTELAPMTGSAPAAESRLLPAGAADELAVRRTRRTLAEKSSTSLLGLLDPVEHPVVEDR